MKQVTIIINVIQSPERNHCKLSLTTSFRTMLGVVVEREGTSRIFYSNENTILN